MEATGKNSIVWQLAHAHQLTVRVEMPGGRVVEGKVLGRGSAILLDPDGVAAGGIEIDAVAGGVAGVPERSRVLEYGQSTWRNLVAWHVFKAAEEAARAQERDLAADPRWVSMRGAVVVGIEQSIGTAAKERLKTALDGLGGPTYTSFVDRLRSALAARLQPVHEDEIRFACGLIAEIFGGDAETYWTLWPRPPAAS